MQKTRTIILLITGIWLLAVPAFGQKKVVKKQIDEARDIIKSGKKLDSAAKLMTDLLKDSVNHQYPKIYVTWFDAVEAQYLQANETLYLKQKYDTAAFFSLTRDLYDIALQLDSVDATPDKKGRVRPEYRKSNAAKLNTLRPNLYYGGSYHVRKNEFDKAFDFYSHYLDAAEQPLFGAYEYTKNDTLLPQTAYWATYCGYRLQQPEKTLRYAIQALNYKQRSQYVLQYMCEAYQQQHRDSAYLETLREGFRQHPGYPYFFPRLADYYTAQGHSDSLMVIADYGLHYDGEDPLFLLAKSMALLQTERYDECIEVSKQMILANDTLPEPHYNIATCYLNQALTLEAKNQPRVYREQLQELYAAARPYMEKYRELMPDDKKRWAPGLYRIYLNLNLGKQFEEIDRLMR